jgi:predicted phage terminase large subunit-like protein
VLSTRYRKDDIHGTTFNEENGWQVISQKAIQVGEDGQEVSYWPEYVSLGELQRLREENPKAFASQYQNDPLDDAGALVQLEWINKGTGPASLDQVVLAIDLAASQREGADYTALVPVGRLANRFFTLRPKKGRWTLDETIREIFTMAESLGERAKRVLIICEAVAYQSAFVTELKRRSQVEDIWAVIEPIPSKSFSPRGNKEERLFGATGVLEAGAMVFEPGTEELIEQLLNFGFMEHDDLADAWVYATLRLIGRRKLETFGLQ